VSRALFLTGAPGTGKTTLIGELAAELADLRPVGFTTREIREAGRRTGFELVDLAGKRRLLAHLRIRGPRIGRYGVDLAGFEAFLDSIPFDDSRARIIIIDEIGRMECLSPRFRTLVTGLLDAGRPLVATIALRGDAFIEGLKTRPHARILTVTPENRDFLAPRLQAEARSLLR
jgi:nucleoside-triphosphatase